MLALSILTEGLSYWSRVHESELIKAWTIVEKSVDHRFATAPFRTQFKYMSIHSAQTTQSRNNRWWCKIFAWLRQFVSNNECCNLLGNWNYRLDYLQFDYHFLKFLFEPIWWTLLKYFFALDPWDHWFRDILSSKFYIWCDFNSQETN